MNRTDKKRAPRPSTKRITAARNEERDMEVVRLYLRESIPQVTIAKRLGISQSYVAEIIAKRKAQWRERRDADIKDQQEEELAKLDHLEATAWQCFELSRLPARETTTEQDKRLEDLKAAQLRLFKARVKINGKNGKGNQGTPKLIQVPKLKLVGEKGRTVVQERPEGNVAFLQLIRWCREVRLKMLGLLQSGDTYNDNRQGVFSTDIWEQMVTAPSATEPENEVEARLRELARQRPARIEAQSVVVDNQAPGTNGSASQPSA